jgi:hypothetical protein
MDFERVRRYGVTRRNLKVALQPARRLGGPSDMPKCELIADSIAVEEGEDRIQEALDEIAALLTLPLLPLPLRF